MMRKIIILFMLLVTQIWAHEFYVSPDGEYSNTGSFERPFKGIQQAATVMRAGDICYIMQGIYRETVTPKYTGQPGLPITFKPYQNDKVIISATNPIPEWTLYKDNIYTAPFESTLGDQNMLVFNGQVMDVARWPNNSDADPWTLDALWINGGSDEYLYHKDIPDIDWTDGVVWFLGKSRWTSWRRPIKNFTPSNKRVYFDLPDGWEGSQHSPRNAGEFYLMNKLEALDHPGEWYYDKEEKLIYFQAPGNVDPNTGVAEFRARTHTIKINDNMYIEFHDINVFGGSIETVKSSNCLLKNIRSLWGNYTIASKSAAFVGDASIKIDGNANRVENCDVSFGSSYGISVGGFFNTITNNYVHDFNFLGSYSCPVYVNGKSNKITFNEIFNGGRDCIRMGGQGHDISFNNVHHSNMINDDCGLLYTCCQNGGGTKIHHNWFHDAESRGTHYKACAVYLDNDSQVYEVYNNVIWNMEWSGIQINWNGWYLKIFNNTIWNVSDAMAAWHKEGTFFKEVIVANNLASDDHWDATEYQNNLDLSTSPFVDAAAGDFRLVENSKPIDAGVNIQGYTNDYVGNAPDVGAYEFGGEFWTAGIDWEPLDFLWTIDLSSNSLPTSDTETTAFPNPFINKTAIQFSLQTDSVVNISVYNVLGNNVCILLNDSMLEAGDHIIEWDGLDSTGKSVGSGIYFCKLEIGSKSKFTKVTKIK